MGVWKRGLALSLLFLLSFVAGATHNRAGEIIYERVQGELFKITIITFTEINNNNADRDTLELFFGDGTSKNVARTRKQPGYNGYTNIQRNLYETEHLYPGPGVYKMSVLDPNRNGGVVNIPNSIERKFYIESYLNITLGASNNSAVLTRDPIAFACNNIPFYYNPGAYDPDGDSLHFEMVACKADFGLPIPDYKFPSASNVFEIDPVTGILTWDAPVTSGEYNVAILISEYREVTLANGSKSIKNVGSILRDMQITVYPNCTNRPPVLSPVPDYCIEAEQTLNFTITASDLGDGSSQSNGDQVTLNAFGGPMLIDPVATFFTSGIDPVTGTFYWETACNHIRKNAYNMTFEAIDNGFPELSSYQVSRILVVAPPVENVQAEAEANSVVLSWDRQKCPQGVGYQIYRRSGSTGFVPDSCELGVPDYLGYSLIHESDDINELTYVDDNFTQGLIPGISYCYLIVTYFADGAESYASEEVCVQLEKDVPILTNVDVTSTDQSNGGISVAWSKPTDHDTVLYPGPYKYRIYRTSQRDFENFVRIDSTIGIDDTTYSESGLNTLDNEYTYRIEMMDQSRAEDRSMGFSVLGTSVYLRSHSKDNQLKLYWDELVPWQNRSYRIYKQNDQGGFDSLTTVISNGFNDSNLTNGNTYCYYVESYGEYSLKSISKPLINRSQIHCNVPEDRQAPCPPVLSLNAEDCEWVKNLLSDNDYRCSSDNSDQASEARKVEQVELSWTNPNLSCDTTDDVDTLKLYFSSSRNGAFRLLHEVYVDKTPGVIQPDEFEFIHQRNNTRAGCYYVNAVDSFGNVSANSDTLCAENCLIYDLPNVFTPNGDGFNDLFTPFPYCYIESVQMKIFNRWGGQVFETTDPDINWDGISTSNGQPVPEGIYFYTCEVDQITVEGTVKVELKGTVTVLGTGVKSSN